MAGVFSRTRIRAAIGLIAAYAIALQALFAAFAPLHANAAGVDFGQVVCFGNASAPTGDDGGAPAPVSGKFHCVLCAASGAAAILPEPVACPLALGAKISSFAPAVIEIALAPSAARSGSPRAPPLTM